jgi:hypothetical protein
MECSVKQKFLAQKRLRPNYLGRDLRRRKASDWLQLISAVASVAFMGIVTVAVGVAYLSTPSAKREDPNALKVRVSAEQETVRITR